MDTTFKDIPGLEGKYRVNRSGVIIGYAKRFGVGAGSDRIMSQIKDQFGYVHTSLTYPGMGQRRMPVHRLVAMTFLGIPTPWAPIVNHVDGIKTNNHVDNLEWCSHSHNRLHALRTGLARPQSGEDHGGAKLTAEQVVDIRNSRLGGTPLRVLARQYSVCEATISMICSRRQWRHVA